MMRNLALIAHIFTDLLIPVCNQYADIACYSTRSPFLLRLQSLLPHSGCDSPSLYHIIFELVFF